MKGADGMKVANQLGEESKINLDSLGRPGVLTGVLPNEKRQKKSERYSLRRMQPTVPSFEDAGRRP